MLHFASPIYYAHHLWTCKARPVAPHNPTIHRTQLFGPFLLPGYHQYGAFNLLIRYLSPEVPDNIYFYDPGLRYVINLSTTTRSENMAGTDIDLDSWGEGFDAKLSIWTFRVLAQKEILAVVHSGKYGDPSAWCAPRDGKHGILAALPCVAWEKRRVWVVEGTPTGYRRQYAYSKRILYIDQDFFGVVLSEMYDQRGELWKGFIPCWFYTNKPYEGYPANPITEGTYRQLPQDPSLKSAVL